MKSLLFTVGREKLLNGEKTLTLRWKFIPQFQQGNIIKIRFKHPDGTREDLFLATITRIEPLQAAAITDEIAWKDGFPDRDTCIQQQMEINRYTDYDRFLNQWGFLIAWKRYKPTGQYTLEGKVTKKKRRHPLYRGKHWKQEELFRKSVQLTSQQQQARRKWKERQFHRTHPPPSKSKVEESKK